MGDGSGEALVLGDALGVGVVDDVGEASGLLACFCKSSTFWL